MAAYNGMKTVQGARQVKTVLVTGGARGIGAAVVRRFTQDGWRVAFSYFQSEEAAQGVSAQTGALGYRADLRDAAQTLAMLQGAMGQLSHLDALVFSAGVSWQGLLSEMPLETYDDLMALNLRSAFVLARAVLPGMVRQASGSLVFVSSIQGLAGSSCEAAYSASKAGLIGLMQALSQEVGPSGIRVNCLAPGVIETDMMAGYSANEREALRLATPLGRLGKAEDVAAAASFLCGPDAGFITGQVLGVDGGLRL